MAVEIIEKNQLQLEKANKEEQEQADLAKRRSSDFKGVMKCKTSDTLSVLYMPKIQQTPSTDNIIDAKNFVEEYEEYHESCSEMQDAQIAISQVMSELNDNVESAIMESQKNKKKKVKYFQIRFSDFLCTCSLAIISDLSYISVLNKRVCSIYFFNLCCKMMTANLKYFRSNLISTELFDFFEFTN